MNLFSLFRTHIITIVKALIAEDILSPGVDCAAITAEPPKDASHGDIATNVAMVLAKPARKSPRALAEMIAERLRALSEVDTADVAGPGFINMRLKPYIWQHTVRDVLESGIGYGNSTLGKGQKVNLEYVSVNPTGPMHIGHARCAVYGDALALLLLKTGYEVTKEYYINDAGSQIDTLARSAYLRYREAAGEAIGEIPAGLYPGDYLIGVGESLFAHYGRDLLDKEEAEWLPLVRSFATDAMMALIREDLLGLGIQHDVFTSEKALHDAGKIEKVVVKLAAKGMVYRGVLTPPKGKKLEDWEEREQVLFRSSDCGDDSDRALQKSNGSWTYFAADVAYLENKLERGFSSLVMILGADHSGYRKRMEAAVKALSNGRVGLDIKLCQLVNFLQNGEPLKMSKRAGTYITVRDVLDLVGKDIIRFMMLTRKNDMVMDFDLEKVKEESKDNPVFYVQYAHARAHSVLRNGREEVPAVATRLKTLDDALLARLESPAELEMIRLIASWPRAVETAALHHEPHRIAFYLQELAAAFHGFWNKGKEDRNLRFILADDTELTAARLALVQSVATVIASGLQIFNVNAVEEM